MSIEARQIQETLHSYAAILNFTPSPQGLRAKFGACSVQNAQLLLWRMWSNKNVRISNFAISKSGKHSFSYTRMTVVCDKSYRCRQALARCHSKEFLPFHGIGVLLDRFLLKPEIWFQKKLVGQNTSVGIFISLGKSGRSILV